jgi:hypothetical protein
MQTDSWWYCLDHSAVEPYYGCRSAARLGPYATEAEAANALDLAAERNDSWENDPLFNDPDPDSESDDEGWGLFG